MWYLLLLLMLKSVSSDEFEESTACEYICRVNKLPEISSDITYLGWKRERDNSTDQEICQRGCRFYYLTKDSDNVNERIELCHSGCSHMQFSTEIEICKAGCDITSKIDAANLDDPNDYMNYYELLEETDGLSDPSIKSQLDIGFNIDYKIPETNIRTMPIEIKNNEIIIKASEPAGDWLDCASRNSGIPRWILLTAFLIAVLVALWLSLSAEKSSLEERKEDVADDTLILCNEEEVEKDPELLLSNVVEFGFSAPPKYTVESEKV